MSNGAYSTARTAITPSQIEADTKTQGRLSENLFRNIFRKESLLLEEQIKKLWEDAKVDETRFGSIPILGTLEDAYSQQKQKDKLMDIISKKAPELMKRIEGTKFGSGLSDFSSDVEGIADKINPLDTLGIGLAKDMLNIGFGKKLGTALSGTEEGVFKDMFSGLKGKLDDFSWGDLNPFTDKPFKKLSEEGLKGVYEKFMALDKKDSKNIDKWESLLDGIIAMQSRPKGDEYELDTSSYTPRYGGYR